MHNTLLKIADDPYLLKDPVSKAIINNDKSGYNDYLRRRTEIQENKKKMFEYEDQIRCLSNEMCEIKELLKQILDKK